MGNCMKMFFVLLFLFFIFPANSAFCTGKTEFDSQIKNEVIGDNSPSRLSMKEQYEAGHFIAKPSDGALIVIGVSNPMSKRQDEIAAAKEDAALKAALYFFIKGKIDTVNNTGSGFLDYQYDSNSELVFDTDYDKYINGLAYDPQNDVLRTGEGVFIRFQYITDVTGIHYNAGMANGRPNWTRNSEKPEFDGYITSVGFSRNQRRLKDTILKATENAALRMIESLSTAVYTKEVSVTGQGSSSFIHTVSEGTLYGFQVIEFWIEPVTRYVYALAVARAGYGL